MGNKQSCCVYSNGRSSSRSQNKTASSVAGGSSTESRHNLSTDSVPAEDANANTLQHISEREHDDLGMDPSLHHSARPLFLQKYENRKESKIQINTSPQMQRSNSCSTIYIDDNTVSQPNLRVTIRCVAIAIHIHLKRATHTHTMDIFDEKLHPLNKEPVSRGYDTSVPSERGIAKFIKMLFNSAQLTAECAIITLVYLERLITYAELEMTPSGWKRIVLGAIILASKVWDDQAVWNVDYCQILKDITVDDMNELERQYLVMIQFNINVPASVYAKYYFSLRYLAEQTQDGLSLAPLSREKAHRLEALSREAEHAYSSLLTGSSERRWHSSEDVRCRGRRSVAVLS